MYVDTGEQRVKDKNSVKFREIPFFTTPRNGSRPRACHVNLQRVDLLAIFISTLVFLIKWESGEMGTAFWRQNGDTICPFGAKMRPARKLKVSIKWKNRQFSCFNQQLNIAGAFTEIFKWIWYIVFELWTLKVRQVLWEIYH